MLADTAVILAGGKSSRMGFDKQCIRLGDTLLIEQQVEQLQSVFKEIIIITNKPEHYQHLNCILAADELKDFGSLGGIHAGLKAASSEYCYFIACDMPHINSDYILYMLGIIGKSGPFQAVATRFGDWLEPFNAFYSKSLLPSIEQAYKDGRSKIGDMLAKAQTYYVEESEARNFSPDWGMFDNINTQADLEAVKKSCSKIVKNNI